MKKVLEFKLTRPAKKSGGDRYESGTENTPDHMVIYVPQKHSRIMNEPCPKLRVTITSIVE